MKSIITMLLLGVTTTLVSFSPNFGGEGFEISLNGKVLIQRYGSDINKVNTLQLNQGSLNDKLTISYHHCGRVGKNRIVTVKDGQDKTVKTWSFADNNETVATMNLYVKDILGQKKASVLKLYYSSSELPKGRMLTSLVVGNNSMAKN